MSLLRLISAITICVFCISPLVYIFYASITHVGQSGVFTNVSSQGVTLLNYKSLLAPQSSDGFLTSLSTSLSLSLCVAFISTAIGLAVGHWLNRSSLASEFTIVSLLGTRIIPPVVIAVILGTLFEIQNSTQAFVVLVFVYSALSLPLTVGLFASLKWSKINEVRHVFTLDGGQGALQQVRVIFPLISSTLHISLGVSFLVAWTDFFFSLMLSSGHLETLPIFISKFETIRGTEWGNLSAAVVVISLPILLLAAVVYSSIRVRPWYKNLTTKGWGI